MDKEVLRHCSSAFTTLRDRIKQMIGERGYVFEDDVSKVLLDQIARMAPSQVPVLITGPTGTGKEIVAELLHAHSGRPIDKLEVVSLVEMPQHLVESALFGHVRGAFTDASTDYVGYVESADGGTLFLDEVGELPIELQPKLLRLLDRRPYKRIGGKRTLQPNVRFIAATNRDLRALCREGRFREDLFARLAMLQIEVPPLRQRPRDVAVFTERQAIAQSNGNPDFVRAVVQAVVSLSEGGYSWPHGMREVLSFVECAACLGINEANRQIRAGWARAEGPSIDRSVIEEPRFVQRDRRALTNLIQSIWKKDKELTPTRAGAKASRQPRKTHSLKKSERAREKGKNQQNEAQARALADVLLTKTSAGRDDISMALGRTHKHTHATYLKPLIQADLVCIDDGDIDNLKRVSVRWPPVIVELMRWQTNTWVPVPPGIPSMKSGEELLIYLETRIDLMVRVYVITHCVEGVHARAQTAEEMIARKEARPNQVCHIRRKLDDTPGFEQILLHMSWLPHKGVKEVPGELVAPTMPTQHARSRERERLLKQHGPGWIREFLVHHVE